MQTQLREQQAELTLLKAGGDVIEDEEEGTEPEAQDQPGEEGSQAEGASGEARRGSVGNSGQVILFSLGRRSS